MQFNPNEVLERIYNLYSSTPDPTTNTWLTHFVEQDDSFVWQILLEILLSTQQIVTDTARFFAAQGLLLKVSNPTLQGESVWSTCVPAFKGHLLQSIFHIFATSPSLTTLLGRRLTLLLCHLVLRVGLTPTWPTPFADVFRAFSQPTQVVWLIEFLTMLPYEIDSHRYNDSTRKIGIATLARTYVLPRVLNQIDQALFHGNEEEKKAACKCLVGWSACSTEVETGTSLLLWVDSGGGGGGGSGSLQQQQHQQRLHLPYDASTRTGTPLPKWQANRHYFYEKYQLKTYVADSTLLQQVMQLTNTNETSAKVWLCICHNDAAMAAQCLAKPFTTNTKEVQQAYQYVTRYFGGNVDLGENAAGVPASTVGLTLTELFAWNVGPKIMQYLATPFSVEVDMDTFLFMVEGLTETLLWPSFQEGAPNVTQGASYLDIMYFEAHATCIARVLSVIIDQCEHLVNSGGSDVNSSANNGTRTSNSNDNPHPPRIAHIMSLVSPLSEHHRETWLGGIQEHDHTSLHRAMRLTNLVLYFTSYCDRKVSIETLMFWESFCEESGGTFAPDTFMQFMATKRMGEQVLGAMSRGCMLRASSVSSTSTSSSTSATSIDESIEEYRSHAVDTVLNIASNWQGPTINGADHCATIVCNLLAQTVQTNEWQPTEAVLWLVIGVVDADDDLLEDDVSEEEEEEDGGGGGGGGGGRIHEPYSTLINLVGNMAASFDHTTHPKMLRTCGRLVERLVPIVAGQCSISSRLAVTLVHNLGLRGMASLISRSDCCQAVYGLSRNATTCRSFIATDNAVQTWIQRLFHQQQSSPSLLDSMMDTPSLQCLVIRAHVNFLQKIPFQYRMPLLQTTLQHLIAPLNISHMLQQVQHNTDASRLLLQQTAQYMKCLEICVRGATPSNNEGCVLLHQLYTSVVVPMSRLVQGNNQLTSGICGVICAMADVLSTAPVLMHESSPSLPSSSPGSTASSLASNLFKDCATTFANAQTYPWLHCLSSLVKCVVNQLLPMDMVLSSLSNLRQYVPAVVIVATNPNYIDVSDTIWMEWLSTMEEFIKVVHVVSSSRGHLLGTSYYSAVGDAFNMAIQLCLPTAANATSNRLPPVLASRRLTTFLTLGLETLVQHTNTNELRTATKQATIRLMAHVLHHFCHPYSGSNNATGNEGGLKRRSFCKITLDLDLSEMIGKMLCNNNTKDLTLIGLQYVLARDLMPVLGKEICQQCLGAFQNSAQAKSSYQRKKKLHNNWVELGRLFQVARGGER